MKNRKDKDMVKKYNKINDCVEYYKDNLDGDFINYIQCQQMHDIIIGLPSFNEEEGLDARTKKMDIDDYRLDGKVRLYKSIYCEEMNEEYLLNNYKAIYDGLVELRNYLADRLEISEEDYEDDSTDAYLNNRECESDMFEYYRYCNDDDYDGESNYEYNY